MPCFWKRFQYQHLRNTPIRDRANPALRTNGSSSFVSDHHAISMQRCSKQNYKVAHLQPYRMVMFAKDQRPATEAMYRVIPTI